MRNMKSIDTAIVSPDWLAKFSRPNAFVFSCYLFLDWSLVLAGTLVFFHFPSVFSFFIASVLIGFGQHGLIVLGHEAVHYRVCRNKRINDLVGNLFCFLPLGLTVGCYRAYHLPHHRDPFGKEDPEIPLREAIGRSFRPPYSVRRGLKLWALSYFGFSLKEMFYLSTMLPRLSNRERVMTGVYWAIVVCMLYFISLSLLPLWLYSQATTYISKLRIQAWFEHGLGETKSNRYAIPNPLYRLLMPHNIWVHYEHHKYPSVPFFHLEEVRALEPKPRVYEMKEMCEELSRGAIAQRPHAA